MSQVDQIFRHLLSGNQITWMDALRMFGCSTCTQRIYDIKEELRTNPLYKGWYIKTHMINGGNGKRWASYELIKSEAKMEVAA
jgi:hypothetical protein